MRSIVRKRFKKIKKKTPNVTSLIIEARVTFLSSIYLMRRHFLNIGAHCNQLYYTTFLIPWKGGGGALSYFVTPNFVQVAFAPKN